MPKVGDFPIYCGYNLKFGRIFIVLVLEGALHERARNIRRMLRFVGYFGLAFMPAKVSKGKTLSHSSEINSLFLGF